MGPVSGLRVQGNLGLVRPARTLRKDFSTFLLSLPEAEGYAEGDLTLYHRSSVTDFLRAANPVDFLSKASEVSPRIGGVQGSSRNVSLK